MKFARRVHVDRRLEPDLNNLRIPLSPVWNARLSRPSACGSERRGMRREKRLRVGIHLARKKCGASLSIFLVWHTIASAITRGGGAEPSAGPRMC